MPEIQLLTGITGCIVQVSVDVTDIVKLLRFLQARRHGGLWKAAGVPPSCGEQLTHSSSHGRRWPSRPVGMLP